MLNLRLPAPFSRASSSVATRPQLQRPLPASRTVVTSSSVLSGLQLGQQSELSIVVAPSNGMRVTMMRHGNKVKHLGRPADQRKALIRGLVTQLLTHGAIRTTKIKAKVIRPFAEHMITLAKQGTLHARRQAMAFVYDKTLVGRLFEGVQERYGERNGGYTRIKTEPFLRRGDAAEMAIIELV
ncbi:hypothetical protein QJQ45_006996 [Haematococcus lacustris]|nr:hypothetical protein QJQ45_006996 [Haematococcus lacustris]